MPKIYLCFLWHMHQPFYKDLVSGEYRLPWTRMHCLKDYYGMAKILEEFPEIRQTFNLVPSLIVQVEEYARGEAHDPFLALSLKPAETLTPEDQAVILRNFFMANPARMIFRYPRYGELFTAWLAQKGVRDPRGVFGPQEFRDLQVLSQVAWFDEEFQDHDPEVRALVEKGRNFSLEDQALMGRKQREICAMVIPQYRKLAESGQIEISTTPFYHPILPLLCDSDIAAVSHPGVPLPPRFKYPEDARLQLQMSRDYIQATFGIAPVGLWPSEGSVSDEVLRLASGMGFEWAATDNGILERTLRRPATPDITYRPWSWNQDQLQIRLIFRDHMLSDLIGFVYSGMGAQEAVRDFLNRIDENCRGILARGQDALVPIILDGENAWEYYARSGRPFFRELYGRIRDDSRMQAVTVSEAVNRLKPDSLHNIFPGSWINANFDVWIGAEEDNKSWRLLLEARRAFELAQDVPEDRRKLALEELLIAEGSDWNWWYGPEHDSANRIEFDQIYRDHLANVYRALGISAPRDLLHPILKIEMDEIQTPPQGLISPEINGIVDSYFEWLGSGVYRVDQRSGSMHGKRELVKDVHYGTDGGQIFLRVDFQVRPSALEGLEIEVEMPGVDGLPDHKLRIRISTGSGSVIEGEGNVAFRDILEIGMRTSVDQHKIKLSFWQDNLPVQVVPALGYLEVSSIKPAVWNG